MSLTIKSAKDVEEKTWEHYGKDILPKGAVSIIAGQGGAGKSTYMCYLAELLAKEAKVLIVSNEEDAGIIKGRLAEDSPVDIASFSSNEKHLKITNADLLSTLDVYDVVFADSMITFNEGKELNKAGTAESFLSQFVAKVTNTNKSLVFLAHTVKGTANTLKEMISGSERLYSGVRHCKVLLNDRLNHKRYIADAKDNTGLPEDLKYELISGVKPNGATIITELLSTDEDMDKLVYLNSQDAKRKRWDKEMFAKERDNELESEQPPATIRRVVREFKDSTFTPTDLIRKLGNNEYTYFVNKLKDTGDEWCIKSKEGKFVTYHFTEKTLTWLGQHPSE